VAYRGEIEKMIESIGPQQRASMRAMTCRLPGCERWARARNSFCELHYQERPWERAFDKALDIIGWAIAAFVVSAPVVGIILAIYGKAQG
jgi:hypothetical protein